GLPQLPRRAAVALILGSRAGLADPDRGAGGARRHPARPEPAGAGAGRPVRPADRAGADEGAVRRGTAEEGVQGRARAPEPGARERRLETRALRCDPRPGEGPAGPLATQRRGAAGLPRGRRRAGSNAPSDEPRPAPRGGEDEETPLSERGTLPRLRGVRRLLLIPLLQDNFSWI